MITQKPIFVNKRVLLDNFLTLVDDGYSSNILEFCRYLFFKTIGGCPLSLYITYDKYLQSWSLS